MVKTYTKKPLTAKCVQWTGDNQAEIEEWCAFANVSPQFFKDSVILRFVIKTEGYPDCKGIHGLSIGSWAVLQENGDIRTYHDDKFRLIYDVK